MASVVTNKKRFKVIKLSYEEATTKCGFGFYGKVILCDGCNKKVAHDEELYYVAVLNFGFCKDCYDKWYKTATHYKEDRKIEERNFKAYAKILNI